MRDFLRSGFLLLCVVTLFGAPFYRQVLEGEEEWIPRWRMFSGKGLGIHRVSFEMEKDGKRQAFRWDDYRPKSTSHSVRRATVVKNVGQIQRHARRVCAEEKKGAKRKAQVRVFARAEKATRNGWKEVLDGQEDLCARKRPRKAHSKARKRKRGGKR